MISYDSFLTRFPEFEGGVDRSLQVEALIQESYLVLDTAYWGRHLDIAAGYYVADAIALSDFNAAYGGMASGAIASRSVQGEYSVSFASDRTASAGTAKTQYATMLDNLRQRIGGGVGLIVDVDKI